MSNWNFLKTTIEKDDFIIDCRNQAAYEESTIKDAYYFPFIKKAFGSDTESQKKMYTPLKAILALINDSGKSRVVVYDEGMGMFSARMVYLLRAIGFRESYMLALKWPFEGVTEKGSRLMEFEPNEKPKPLNGVVDKAFMEKNLKNTMENFLASQALSLERYPADFLEHFFGTGKHFMIKRDLSLAANYLSNDFKVFLLCLKGLQCSTIITEQDLVYAL